MDPAMIIVLVRLAVELLPLLIKALEYLVPRLIEFFDGLNPAEQTQLRQAWAAMWGV